MSKPGFPVVEMATTCYQDHFLRGSDGAQFDGSTCDNYISYHEDKDGSNTPGFPQVLQDNPYFHLSRSRHSSPVTVDANHVDGSRSWGTWTSSTSDAGFHPYHLGIWPGVPEGLAEMRARLLSKLAIRVKDQRINIRQAIAERDKTANLVGKTARRCATALSQLRRGNFPAALRALTGDHRAPRGFARSFGGIPEQWIAIQYGWKPLLADIDGACKELAALLVKEPPACSARAGTTVVLDRYETVERGAYYPIWPGTRWVREEADIQGRGYIEYSVSSDFGQTLARTGIIDPLLLAWELLPYSFIVDWMIPVGSWLESLQFDVGLEFNRGYISWKYRDKWTAKLESFHTAENGWNHSFTGGDGQTSAFHFERELIEGAFVPPPPSFKNPFSLQHMANGLSLLATSFGGRSGARPIYK